MKENIELVDGEKELMTWTYSVIPGRKVLPTELEKFLCGSKQKKSSNTEAIGEMNHKERNVDMHTQKVKVILASDWHILVGVVATSK